MSKKPLLSAILLVVLAGCVGCNQDESYDWGDPIPIPDHPAFIWNAGPDANTITVLDLDKNEIAGRRRCLPQRTLASDLAVLDKHELLFPIDYANFDTELGEEITIIDPTLQEQKVGSIKTYPGPADIYPLSNDKVFVSHAFRSFQDSFWTTTLIDMRSRKVLAEFHLQDMIYGVVEFPDGRVYLFYSGWGGSSKDFMREFYSATNTLGNEVEISESVFSFYGATAVSDSLFCVAASRNGKTCIEFIRLPGFNIEASVILPEDHPSRMACVNNKLYVCHNTGEIMEHGNYKKVSVIDLEAKAVTKVLTVCNAPCDIAYSAATNKIVVVSGVGTVITIIDSATDSVINTIVSDEVGDVDDEWGYDRLRIPE